MENAIDLILVELTADVFETFFFLQPGRGGVYRVFSVWRTGKPCHAPRISRKFRGFFFTWDGWGRRKRADDTSESPGPRRRRYEGAQ